MPDRLTEIRARLDSFRYAVGDTHTMPANYIGPCEDEFYDEAPADIAWLLDEVERLRRDDYVVQGVTKWERTDA